MSGRRQASRSLPPPPTNHQQLPVQPSIVDQPGSGSVPWQSVVLGENVAYSKDPMAPPPYEDERAVKDKKKDPEYDYIETQRELTTITSSNV